MKNLIIVLIILSFCTNAAGSTKDIVVNDTGYISSYFCLTNQLDSNGIPKYCGATGTYTHKHIPVAVSHGGHTYEVYSDNSFNGNIITDKKALRIYLIKDQGPKVLVHTEEDWDDPHMNAVVDVDEQGYIWIHMSSRGLGHKFRSGFVFKSIAPHSFVMKKVKGGTNDPHNESYPQVHHTAFGKIVMYSHYEQLTGTGRNYRTIWVNKEGVTPYKLVNGGHYQVSWYDEDNATLYTAYNYHPDGYQDSPLNHRANVFVLKTTDGVNWLNVKGDLVASPNNYLPTRSVDSLVYDSEFRGLTIYLKDIITDCDGNLRILMTESMSHEPSISLRQLSELKITPTGQATIQALHRTNHNYSAGTYLYEGCQLYTLSNGDNKKPYFGGDLILKKWTGSYYAHEKTYADGLNYSYVRRVRGDAMNAVASKGEGTVSDDNTHVRISIE